MAEFRLLVTADYEVWGDGSGCVDKCMIEPAAELLTICEAHGSRLTLFLDVCEYWAFEEAEKSGKFRKEYQPASSIARQLAGAVKKGHDVQLHTHPQWLNSRYRNDHAFDVDLNLWRTGLLPRGTDADRQTVNGLIKQGRATLEALLQPVIPAYRCNAFRAGDWCIQPEQDVLDALGEAGMAYDTSASRGIYRKNFLSQYDFRWLPDKPVWRVQRAVSTHDPSGSVTEVPIASAPFGMGSQLYYLIRLAMNKKAVRCAGSPAIKRLETSGGRLMRIWSKLMPQHRMLDFSDGSSLEDMKYIVRRTMQRFSSLDDKTIVPIVMIGHPKNFTDAATFSKFLQWASKQSSLQLDTLSSKSFWQR